MACAYSVVIPLFNEARNLPELYRRLKDTLESLSASYETILVDDGSTDNSFELLKNIASSDNTIKVLHFNKNYGQHKAATAGLVEACGDYIITLDADLQNPPEEIPKLIAKMSEGFDMVSGYRAIRKDALSRRVPSMLTNLLIFGITGLKMKDYGSMFRIFKRGIAKAIAAEFKKTEGYITMLVAKVTRNVAEIEVGHDKRYSGQSKYNIFKLVVLFFRILVYYNENVRKIFGIKTEEPLFIIDRKIENGRETAVSFSDR